MLSFRLRRLYRLTGVIVLLGLLTLGGSLFWTALQTYRMDKAEVVNLERFRLALVAANAIQTERGPSNGLMAASPEAVAALHRTLGDTRRQTDLAVDAMRAAFRAPIEASPSLGALALQVTTTLAAGRNAVDRAAAEEPAQRDLSGIRQANERMFDAADAVGVLTEGLGQSVVRETPGIEPDIMLGLLCNDMRQYAGRLAASVVIMLESPEAPDPALRDAMLLMEGRLKTLRGVVGNHATALFDDPSVATALADVDHAYFGRTLPFAWAVANHATAGTGPRMSFAQFAAFYVPGLKALEALRDHMITLSQRHIDADRSGGQSKLVLAGSLTLAVAGLLVFLRAVLSRLLLVPVLEASDQLDAIARGDLSEPVAQRRLGEEARHLFDALRVLRQVQRAKKALDDDRERDALGLRRLAETDALTGLMNRRALESVARKAVAQAAVGGPKPALILFDIDRFKQINDTYGHIVGDQILVAVADCVRDHLGPDDLAARFGGEEFVVLTTQVRPGHGESVAETLRASLSTISLPVMAGRGVTASFGVAVFGADAPSWQHLFADADRRLYRAKHSGRNRVCSLDILDERVGSSLSLAS